MDYGASVPFGSVGRAVSVSRVFGFRYGLGRLLWSWDCINVAAASAASVSGVIFVVSISPRSQVSAVRPLDMFHHPFERHRIRWLLIDFNFAVRRLYLSVMPKRGIFVCIEYLVGDFIHAPQPFPFEREACAVIFIYRSFRSTAPVFFHRVRLMAVYSWLVHRLSFKIQNRLHHLA